MKNREKYRDEILNSIQMLKSSKIKLDMISELSKFSIVVEDDINQLEFLEKNLDNWDKAYQIAQNLKFKTWPTDKKVVIPHNTYIQHPNNASLKLNN